MTPTEHTEHRPPGEVVEARRVQLGLSKSEASRRAGLTRGTWHEVESGVRRELQPLTYNRVDETLGWESGTLWSLMHPGERVAAVDRTAAASANRPNYKVRTDGMNIREASVQMQFDELRQLIYGLSDELEEIRQENAELRQAVKDLSGQLVERSR
jgi:hypothetical protein